MLKAMNNVESCLPLLDHLNFTSVSSAHLSNLWKYCFQIHVFVN